MEARAPERPRYEESVKPISEIQNLKYDILSTQYVQKVANRNSQQHKQNDPYMSTL